MTLPTGTHPAGDDVGPTASLAALRVRAELLRRLRAFFDSRGFLEVETPLLSADTVVDRHLDPLRVTLFDDPAHPDTGPTFYLQTSPEFGMKRLLAAGFPSIYQVTRAFRGAERGPWHNPEFTIVEWYGVGQDYEQGQQLLSDLAEILLERGPAQRLTYAEAFRRHADLDPHTAGAERLSQFARQHGIAVPDSLGLDDPDSWLDLLLAECVQPHLGRDRPVILCDYPASQAALAQVRPASPPVAERFELYCQGVELANGYHELRDPEILYRRNETVNRQRRADGKPRLPSASRLLLAMHQGLPECTGVALGLDRLAMLVTAAADISEVLAFPLDRA